MITDEQKLLLRAEILAAAALRHPSALTPRQLGNRAATAVDFKFDLPDAASACEYLRSLGHLAAVHDDMGGAVQYYQATAAGLAASERRAAS